MESFNYDSYCGIYCGACDILQAYKTGKKHKLASFWNEKNIRKYHLAMGNDNASRSCAIHCNGCKSNSLFINCASCKIRECAMGKEVEHCSECGEYPCSLFGDSQKAQIVLPHLKENQPNLESIKKNGTEKWLADQEKRWQCPQCRAGISWYTSKCSQCGTSLKSKAYRFTWMQSVMLKSSFSSESKKPTPRVK
ncbi:MAG: DUF3795 domain-containing protein [Ruminiclostridium sp.]|nr:DUF3795 domain-containing protein [Ruminiclostridium sp.]